MQTTRYSTAKTPDFVDRDSFSFAIKHLALAFEDRLRKIEQNQASIASFINTKGCPNQPEVLMVTR